MKIGYYRLFNEMMREGIVLSNTGCFEFDGKKYEMIVEIREIK